MKELVKTLATEFDDKDYAHAYMETFSNMAIAAQIKALREQRGWTQQQLATQAGMKQARIAVLEDVDYESWTLKNLRKLARAFDLTVKVSFETFSSGIVEATKINAESLKRTSREADLMAFSAAPFSYQETVWSTQSVKTTKPMPYLAHSSNRAVNDFKYNAPGQQRA